MNIPENYPYAPQLLTPVTIVPKELKTIVTTVAFKGENYAKIDDLFNQLTDLVDDKFKLWYYKRFYKLGTDQVMRFASMARLEAKIDKRRYFSWLLKNNQFLK